MYNPVKCTEQVSVSSCTGLDNRDAIIWFLRMSEICQTAGDPHRVQISSKLVTGLLNVSLVRWVQKKVLILKRNEEKMNII